MAWGRGARRHAPHQGGPRPRRADEPRQGPALRLVPLARLALLAACAAPNQPPFAPPAGAFATIRSGERPGCVATGGAVHLGAGRFLTAAHVVDGTAQALRPDCPLGAPLLVVAGGATAPARLLRAGASLFEPGLGQRYLGGEDVALVEAPLSSLPADLPAAALCRHDALAGDEVVVVTPRRRLGTRIQAIARDPAPGGAYPEIPHALEPGESGGAALDAALGCVLGLVSHRDRGEGPPRTRLVPAPVLRRIAGG